MNRIDDLMRNKPLKILDDFYAGVLLTDNEKTVLYSNSAFNKLFREKKNKIIGRKCYEIMHPDDPECKGCPNGLCHNLEVKIDGKVYNMVVSGSSCGSDLVLRVIQDITYALDEIKQLKKEVNELRDKISGLLGNNEIIPICAVCHKIRLIDGCWVEPVDSSRIDISEGLSHGYCPNCAKELVAEINSKILKIKKKKKT